MAKNKQAADAVVSEISQAEIDEIVASSETVVETNTKVEDRTDNPVEDSEVEYEVTEEKIAGGTILTSYGEPVGGRGEAEAE